MKFLAPSLLLASLAASSPITPPSTISISTTSHRDHPDIEARQFADFGIPGFSTMNDLVDGDASACPKVVLVFGRATLEPGNMGISTGPALASGLRALYGETGVWVQGIGNPYMADFANNFAPQGASSAAIGEAVRLLELAASKCPGSGIVVGGYSQGSAVVAAALGRVGKGVRGRVRGVVLFGYSQNKQNHGLVPGFPSEKVKVFCALGDLVCQGSLAVTFVHFSYLDDAAGPAVEFLSSKIGV
ncbi:hypothetical protein E8E13_006134 [Curvularia kusanoi]|uniref:Cutinase n=1 Tax=Curvularia kusanoi TaxID=90978 RepID=A0A9P4T7T8_CURKU|nr:hypothetical protein E8E13_006134 [Curvularia kusanoi]